MCRLVRRRRADSGRGISIIMRPPLEFRFAPNVMDGNDAPLCVRARSPRSGPVCVRRTVGGLQGLDRLGRKRPRACVHTRVCVRMCVCVDTAESLTSGPFWTLIESSWDGEGNGGKVESSLDALTLKVGSISLSRDSDVRNGC